MDQNNIWARFKDFLFIDHELGLWLDPSRMKLNQDFFEQMEPRMQQAYAKMSELEQGAIANPDENRMVGHYWLRDPGLSPDKEITRNIYETLKAVKQFSSDIRTGKIRGEKGRTFCNILLIGIGGSSLGPRFAADALGKYPDRFKTYFLDNTDPDGIDRVLLDLKNDLDRTVTIVISKSGGTVETRNCMEEVRFFYRQQGLDFTKHAVSITQPGSLLERKRTKERWLAGFPIWDFIGGRTSVLSAVGLLPLALRGINIDRLLAGARKCDELTRRTNTRQNPSALLALSWYAATGGQGGKQMVVLPYKDRLELFAKYLQQLIMESLGKEKDLEGKIVKQGITVFGNKGSSDQHSYLQQLLDGPDNFFVTFIEVLKDRDASSPVIAENSTSGDYLQAFYLGTRKALSAKGRESLTITIREVNEYTIGVLLALYERAVGFYAFLVNINAYHQPAVEFGKKVAGEIINMKNQIIKELQANKNRKYTLSELAGAINREDEMEDIFRILARLVNNPDYGIKMTGPGEGADISDWLYWNDQL